MTLLDEASTFVSENIKSGFHDKRLRSIGNLQLGQVLRRKNPYLFKAKAVTAAPDLVQQLLDAHLSSNEETLFGEFLETLAIQVCGTVYGGQKSTSEGIDLEFTRDKARYAVSVKSGPNWGNSRQIKKMIGDFNTVRRIAGHRTKIVCVNGCCYGRDGSPHKANGDYLKLCGEDFWFLISNERSMYQALVEPLGYQARQHCDEFLEAYGSVRTRFTVEFAKDFCSPSGAIDWPSLLKLNSGSKTPWQP